MTTSSNVEVLVGDIFESPAQTLTNTINTVGIMGKGIALGFRQRFPDMYDDYVRRCQREEVTLGEPYLFQGLLEPWILNFPTKQHWRSPSRLDAIRSGLAYLAAHYERWGIESLAVPSLGCGEGGLDWGIVGPTLLSGLEQLDIPVTLFAPFGTPAKELDPDFLRPGRRVSPQSRVPAAEVALAVIVGRITSWRHHYPIGRTSFEKICYFATRAGIPTGLQFEKRAYGPFSPGSKQLKARLINNGVIHESRRGRMFVITAGPTLADATRAFQGEIDGWEPLIEKVVDLFLRLPGTRAAELVATVDYVAELLANQHDHRGGTTTEDEVVEHVRRWKKGRSPAVDDREILNGVRTLGYLGWAEVQTEDDDLIPV
ncbi:MAG: macro domain-containing protein [bacterium]|nr:macro domain-containing protein [bacterium]